DREHVVQHLRVVVVKVELVAGGDGHHRSLAVRVGDCGAQRAGKGDGAEAHAHHPGVMVGGIGDRLGQAPAVVDDVVGGAQGQEAGTGCDPGDADAVVGGCPEHPGYVGAVRVLGVGGRVAVVGIEVVASRRPAAGEIGVVELNAEVDVGDR